MTWFAGESQVISAAVARWTGGSEVADPVERAFAGAEPLCVEAVIPEVDVGLLEEEAGVGKAVQVEGLAETASVTSLTAAEAKASKVKEKIPLSGPSESFWRPPDLQLAACLLPRAPLSRALSCPSPQ